LGDEQPIDFSRPQGEGQSVSQMAPICSSHGSAGPYTVFAVYCVTWPAACSSSASTSEVSTRPGKSKGVKAA